ncbi:MAG: TonB-dependent receptor [Chitinophagaceae bacterium]|nr:TonB-dependent receptor [Chitinophagaceae bacterium]
MRRIILIPLLLQLTFVSQAQKPIESDRSLDSIVVISYLNQNAIRPLPGVHGTFLYSGKKTETIDLSYIPADISNKTGRQVFAKIPGVFVYDMDGAGNQVNISTRGLDPHRGWEFNVRKDGIITNSDMYGYPASHYSMPLESTARIELVRGTGSLQYGAQFGGMLNYVTKQGDTSRAFGFENITTVGSFNLLSTYNAVGGKAGKWKYYAYFYNKSRDGFRKNEHTSADAQSIVVNYEPTKRFMMRMEWARSTYRYRIPGGLTDSMFHVDPTQATRSRNYFSPDIHVPSLTFNWQAVPNLKLQFTLSAVLGRRNSVLFDKPTNVLDTINHATFDYNNRQVDIDRFNSYTAELRLLNEFSLGKVVSTLAAGVQYMNNDLHRTQLGKGTTGSDFDLTLVDPTWGRDVHLKTKNIALYAENKFQLLENLSFNVGGRVEIGKTDLDGIITYYPDEQLPVRIRHQFPLLGFNISYKPNNNSELYGGCSQAYHPMLFKDLIPGSLFEKVDSNIKDAKGYNAELGWRGAWKFLRWDVTGFLLNYRNRFGTLAGTDVSGNFYTYRTNIGNSISTGGEILVQADWYLSRKLGISLFTSTALMNARYKNATIKSGNNNVNIDGNKVESAPGIITRNGGTIRYKQVSFSALYSYTGESFADALNTVTPPRATGAVGIVPAYGILDFNFVLRYSRALEARVNINNVTDKKYFTKRPSFYPGPGVWPSDGRNFSVSLAVRM